MAEWLKESTSVSVVLGPIWATADGALKADLAYNASGINCDVYKNGTKADVTLANSAGDGYFRAASGESLYLLTLSTGHTDTLGRLTISLSATGYYMRPQHYMVVPANVWDSMFGSDKLQVETAELGNGVITAAAFDESTAYPLKSADTGSTAVARTGADADTLKTLSDQMDAFADEDDVAAAVRDVTLVGATAGGIGAAITDILADTGELQSNQGDWATATGFSTHSAADVWAVATKEITGGTVDTCTTNTDMVAAAPTAQENAEYLLEANLGDGTDSESRSVRNALRILRNKVSISAGTMTVTKEDDSTEAWTASVTGTEGADPITAIDPAGPA